MMSYNIVEANSVADLQKAVQALLEQGWELQGGVSVATYGAGSWWYYQAMVLFGETQETSPNLEHSS